MVCMLVLPSSFSGIFNMLLCRCKTESGAVLKEFQVDAAVKVSKMAELYCTGLFCTLYVGVQDGAVHLCQRGRRHQAALRAAGPAPPRGGQGGVQVLYCTILY